MSLAEQNFNDLLEIVTFIKDNAATKEDIFGLKGDVSGLKSDVSGLKSNITDLTMKVITIEEKIDALPTREEYNVLQTAVDGYAKKADAYFQEMVMLSSKVNRLERWIQELAAKADLKLEY